MSSKQSTDPRFLTYADLERIYKIPKGTSSCWVFHKKVPHLRFGPRCVRFDKVEFEAWLDSHRIAVGGA